MFAVSHRFNHTDSSEGRRGRRGDGGCLWGCGSVPGPGLGGLYVTTCLRKGQGRRSWEGWALPARPQMQPAERAALWGELPAPGQEVGGWS